MDDLVRPSPHFATYALHRFAFLPGRRGVVPLRHHVMGLDGPAPEQEMKLGDELEHELTHVGVVLERRPTLKVLMTDPWTHLGEEFVGIRYRLLKDLE